MRTLKLLVIGLGVVIVVATAALVTIIVQRAGRLGASHTASAADSPIAVPPGFRVAGTDISGDRLLVRLEGRAPGADSDEVRLLVLDLGGSNGQRTLRLMLSPTEAPQ